MVTFTVTTASDVVDANDGVLSLREAVQRANATAAVDSILFASGLESRTLTLSQGQLTVTNDVRIDGDRDGNGSRVTIDGNRESGVLAVSGGQGTAAALTDLTITRGGSLDPDNGAAGGGIFVGEGQTLTMTRSTVSDCFGYGAGGGLFLARGSSATIVDSIIRNNSTSEPGTSTGDASQGGGVCVVDATLTLVRSTIADNASGYRGGGIYARDSTVRLLESTVSGNRAAKFVAQDGGGIFAEGGSTSLANSTVTGNYAANAYSPGGGGIRATGLLSLANSIVAGNFSGYDSDRVADDVRGTVTSSNGHNIFGSIVTGEVAGDLESIAAARLFAGVDAETGGGELAANGGPTPTVRLRNALDNPALSGADPLDAGAVDQRGVSRPQPIDSNPDIGSFELLQRAISTRPTDGNDVLTGTTRIDVLNARAGNDLVRGLAGDDDLRGADGSDTLRGGSGRDRLDGGSASDLLDGGGENDLVLGGGNADVLFGGRGDDLLRGQFGTDLARGGDGRDVFDFDPGDTGVGVGRRDLILDFGRGADRVDLTSIDAQGGRAGDQAFAFLGTGALTGAGQLRFSFVGDSTVIQGSTDGDAAAELELQLAGRIRLDVDDFLL